MKKYLFFLGLFVSFFTATLAHANLTEQQRVADAEQLVNLFHHRYAPMSWKEKLWKIDRNDIANKLMEEAANAKNDIEFYEAVIRYLGALQDAHVSWDIPSTAEYAYGIVFQYFGKSILVNERSRQVHAEHPELFAGDVLLTINGAPAEDELKKILHYIHTGNELADKKQAALLINYRPQRIFPNTPHDGDKVVLGIRSATSKQEYSIELVWEKWSGFDIASFNQPDLQLKKSLLSAKAQTIGQSPQQNNGNGIGIPNGSFPLWNSFVLRNEKPFVSGIFIANEKRIGFLRLHTWNEDSLGILDKDALNFLANEISFLQKSTDALVIDQNDNGGGDICLGESVAGFFTSTPQPGMLFALRPTRSWLVRYEKDLQFEENEWKRRLIERQISAIRDALQGGAELTTPVSLCNADGIIRPMQDTDGNKITYTHPVLLLINQDSCSTADMFPAMMQDMGAATTLGATTHGCGGSVWQQENLGYSDITVRFTASLGVRAKPQTLSDGTQTNYIENIGVTPDIPYEFSEKDFYDDHENYRKAIEKAVMQLIEQRSQSKSASK